ncbi:helix-turn-helix domain-containing protein [Devosia sp. XJ19-1]|uniref:Helix-turn-helix domain-containing protein n=1 Tax=Devosia ureilytica TaxID=2952754 RepID=A0A9Q4FRG8_9HYPH|nr:helix-turn-helix domain-containing protein [Devosia ureilytica]MCP8883828.1 helix-turn-helix domain-containing protein [Devosia ureilytica]MCP8887436.1 helix-turn-helix domain-containing protein [Devosia ureilytica]
MSMDADQLDRIFKALADPTRRGLVDRLATRPGQSLFELCAAAVADGQPAMSRQAVSQHLDMLEKAGLVQVTWVGRTKLHTLDLTPLRAAQAAWLGRHM